MISVSENDFKDKVSIRFNNITEGINRFENKTLEGDKSDDFEKSLIGFLEEAVKLNGVENSYVDFYYNILEEDQKNKFKDFLSLEDKEFLKRFEEENTKGGIYYNLSLESIPFVVKITAQEILFSTIYFTKEPFTIWGNYNKKFPIFYNDEFIFNKYNSIAKIFNLKMV